jgi:phenylacetate-CoA ligase
VPEAEVHEITLTSGTSGQGQEVHAQTVRDAHLRGQMTAVGYAWSGLTKRDIAVFHITATNSASLWTMVRGIRTVGRLPYLVGHMGFEERLEFMERFGVNAMYAMPSTLNGLATLCVSKGIDPRKAFPNLRFVMMSAESWPVDWVLRMEDFWGVKIVEEFGSTQTNAAYGASCCEYGAVVDGERGSNHLFEWTILYEIIDPESGLPVAPGESGEVIVTHLDKEASPLMRFRTADRATYFPHSRCRCGRALDAVEAGTIGRIDDMLKVKGENIWPSQIDRIVFARREVDEWQFRVFIGSGGRDEVEMLLSTKDRDPAKASALADELVRELKAITNLTIKVKLVAPEDLPHFDTPDKKPRRWKDDRHSGLVTGLN